MYTNIYILYYLTLLEKLEERTPFSIERYRFLIGETKRNQRNSNLNIYINIYEVYKMEIEINKLLNLKDKRRIIDEEIKQLEMLTKFELGAIYEWKSGGRRIIWVLTQMNNDNYNGLVGMTLFDKTSSGAELYSHKVSWGISPSDLKEHVPMTPEEADKELGLLRRKYGLL